MESIKIWFQDWSDACEFAKECAPDLSFLPGEPFTALLGVAALCFLLWWRNERALRARLAAIAATYAPAQPVEARGGLTAALDRARVFFPAAPKKAA